MGEKQNQPFQLSFNASLKIDFQGSRVTSDGGLILVRELDERLRFGELIAQHLSDSRRGKNTQLPLADLFRQSVYSRIAGYEDVNDAARLSPDPAFRSIGSEKTWDRGAVPTSRLQTFETEMLAEEESFGSLARINRELIGKAEASASPQRVVLDMDSPETLGMKEMRRKAPLEAVGDIINVGQDGKMKIPDWEARGGHGGSPEADWLRAEQALKSRQETLPRKRVLKRKAAS